MMSVPVRDDWETYPRIVVEKKKDRQLSSDPVFDAIVFYFASISDIVLVGLYLRMSSEMSLSRCSILALSLYG